MVKLIEANVRVIAEPEVLDDEMVVICRALVKGNPEINRALDEVARLIRQEFPAAWGVQAQVTLD